MNGKHVVAEVDDVTVVRTKATMLLYPSRGYRDGMRGGEGSEQLSGDVALKRPHDLLSCPSFVAASGNVGAGREMGAHKDDDDGCQRSVEPSINAPIESVPHRVS